MGWGGEVREEVENFGEKGKFEGGGGGEEGYTDKIPARAEANHYMLIDFEHQEKIQYY